MRAAASSCLTSFDKTNPSAQRWASNQSAKLVTEVSDETMKAIRAIMSQAFEEGMTPAMAARLIRDVVGLHSRQAQAVVNLATQLRNAEPGTLITRFPPAPGLRGKPGFIVRIPQGGLSEARIQKLLKKYSDMHLNSRARTIARTETLRASNQGVRELWMQGRDSGQLPRDAKRVWIKNTERHADRDGVVIRVDEDWPWGTEPGEEVNCGCGQGLATKENIADPVVWQRGENR